MEAVACFFGMLMISLCGVFAYGNKDLTLPYTCTTTTRLCRSGESESLLTLDSSSSVQHGRPGKRGIRGPKGEKGDACGCEGHATNAVIAKPTTLVPAAVKGMKGDKGEPGRSVSDTEELQDMRARIEKLEADVLERVSAQSSTTVQVGGTDSILLSPFPKSCSEVRRKKGSNIEAAVIYPFLSFHDITPIKVNCSEDDGWITIQRRTTGSVNFYRTWRDYTEGFGNKDGEFWLGLKHIYRLTSQHPYELYIGFKLRQNANHRYARYGLFYVGNEASFFRLVVGDYSGNYVDYLQQSNGRLFSTYDSDHDSASGNCGQLRKGAWWYTGCGSVNLNGQYSGNYFTWGPYISFSEMKIRPRC